LFCFPKFFRGDLGGGGTLNLRWGIKEKPEFRPQGGGGGGGDGFLRRTPPTPPRVGPGKVLFFPTIRKKRGDFWLGGGRPEKINKGVG